MLTEALNLATQRLAAAGAEQQRFLEWELKATKMLHAAAAEVEVLRSASGALVLSMPFPSSAHSQVQPSCHHNNKPKQIVSMAPAIFIKPCSRFTSSAWPCLMRLLLASSPSQWCLPAYHDKGCLYRHRKPLTV